MAASPVQAPARFPLLARTGALSSVRDRSRSIPEWVAVPLAVWASSRILLLVIAQQAPRFLAAPRAVASPSVLPHGDLLASIWSWSSPWFRFDSRWFVGVAAHGYHWGANSTANTNFLPVYPLATRALAVLTAGSLWLAAWVLANGACLAAMILLYRWARFRFDSEVATRVILLTVSFPFAFFLSAAYAESLFLALAAGAFLAAETDLWGIAATLAGIATLTRPLGVALVAGLLVMAISRGRARSAILQCLALIPLLGFACYLTLKFGQPLGFLVNHSGGWVPFRGGVLSSVGAQFHTYLTPFDRVDAALAVLFLASGVAAWRLLGAGYGVYVLLGVLIPLAHGLVGMERYVIVLFPAMAAWGLSGGKGRQTAIFSLSLAGLLMATMMFSVGFALS